MSMTRLLSAVALCAAFSATSASAHAQSITKNPGDHPDYKVEVEPHLDLGWSHAYYASNGYGLGARFSIPIVQNGFIPTLNNSIALSFGLDWLRYSGCYSAYYSDYYGGC